LLLNIAMLVVMISIYNVHHLEWNRKVGWIFEIKEKPTKKKRKPKIRYRSKKEKKGANKCTKIKLNKMTKMFDLLAEKWKKKTKLKETTKYFTLNKSKFFDLLLEKRKKRLVSLANEGALAVLIAFTELFQSIQHDVRPANV
jgi:hypothetical protein